MPKRKTRLRVARKNELTYRNMQRRVVNAEARYGIWSSEFSLAQSEYLNFIRSSMRRL